MTGTQRTPHKARKRDAPIGARSRAVPPPAGEDLWRGFRQRQRPPRRRRDAPLHSASAVLDSLMAALNTGSAHADIDPEQLREQLEQRRHLTRLWQHWDMVMGAELATLAIPLGVRQHSLLIGGEDAMALQELSLMAEEILERANAFMGTAHFSEVRVSLPQGKPDLRACPHPDTPFPAAAPPLPWGPPLTGDLLGAFSPDNPAARCYAAYVAASRERE